MDTIDKIQIAEEMMAASIVEYLENQRFYAAIDLAGVAEELYGKMVRIWPNAAHPAFFRNFPKIQTRNPT